MNFFALLRKSSNYTSLYSVGICISIALNACGQDKRQVYGTPQAFDLHAPVIIPLPNVLREISGICFYPQQDDTIYAQQDEDGILFSIEPTSKEIRETKFGKKGDYEDITIYKENFILLRSDGTLFSIPFASRNFKETKDVKTWKNLLPKGEYESIFYDPDTDLIYTLCKTCPSDRKTNKTSGFILKMTKDERTMYGSFSIDNENPLIKDKLNGKVLRPSALAKNNRTNEWYVLSSVDKLLVITDNNWQVIASYKLDPKFFTQPEGIAFDSKGNLYISNEAYGKVKNGTILKFDQK